MVLSTMQIGCVVVRQHQNCKSFYSGDHFCLHQVRNGFARCFNGSHVHPLVEDGYLPLNAGSAHTVEANESPVLSICLPTSLLHGEKFSECLTPRDFRIDRAISGIVSAFHEQDSLQLEKWATELVRSLQIARDSSSQMYFLNYREARNWRDLQMKGAREFILSNLERPVVLADISDHCAMSLYNFHRTFASWHGITPGNYLIVEKVRRACRKLVITNNSIAKIAEDCGYFSSTTFAGTFKKITGYCPSGFREMACGFRNQLEHFVV